MIAPVIEINPTGHRIPKADWSAVLATSANAFRALDRADRLMLLNTPLHCVGEKTAKIAREHGFEQVFVGGGSGEKLVEEIKATYPKSSRLLYLTGSPRKPGVERGLLEAGFDLTGVELYRAESVRHWPGPFHEEMMEADVALHFSRASVETLLGLAERAGLMPKLRFMRHVCLSQDVAEPLTALGIERVESASRASEDEMIGMV
jgi:uroporphyrinogen-III synthase